MLVFSVYNEIQFLFPTIDTQFNYKKHNFSGLKGKRNLASKFKVPLLHKHIHDIFP